MSTLFDSLNPYNSLQAIVADSPQELVLEIQKIRTPINILGFTQMGAKSVAYIMGDHRIKKGVTKNGSKNSSGS